MTVTLIVEGMEGMEDMGTALVERTIDTNQMKIIAKTDNIQTRVILTMRKTMVTTMKTMEILVYTSLSSLVLGAMSKMTGISLNCKLYHHGGYFQYACT
jgi:hypothetical protein